jgi:hypothetical protein
MTQVIRVQVPAWAPFFPSPDASIGARPPLPADSKRPPPDPHGRCYDPARAVSSARLERLAYTEEVRGSSPLPPTNVPSTTPAAEIQARRSGRRRYARFDGVARPTIEPAVL